MSQTITILGSERKESKNGREFLSVQTSSGTLFCWDQKLWGNVHPGIATVEIEEKPGQNGGNPFRYLTAILDSQPAANPSQPSHDRETNIRRQVALKAAVELVAGVYPAMADREQIDLSKLVLDTAEAFDVWLTNNDEELLF